MFKEEQTTGNFVPSSQLYITAENHVCVTQSCTISGERCMPMQVSAPFICDIKGTSASMWFGTIVIKL